MRRAILTLTVLLLIGAALSLVAAWTCAVAISPDAASDGLNPQQLNLLRREFFERPGPDPGGRDAGRLFVSVAHVRPGVEFLDVAVEDADLGANAFKGPLPYLGVTRAGWPALAFEAQWYHDASRALSKFPPRTTSGFAFATWYVRGNRLFIPRMLPFGPMWPGCAIDILFWTAAAALVWFVPLLARRLVRRWRHRCIACGYPIGTSPVCTECGREVRPIPHAKLSA